MYTYFARKTELVTHLKIIYTFDLSVGNIKNKFNRRE